jgi:hypothetical protein
LAREQYAEDGNNDDDEDEDIMKLDDKKPLEGMTVCVSGQLQCPKVTCACMYSKYINILLIHSIHSAGSDRSNVPKPWSSLRERPYDRNDLLSS